MKSFRAAVLALAIALIGSAAEFDVASVKAKKSADPPYANFPLGPGDVYVPNGGILLGKELSSVHVHCLRVQDQGQPNSVSSATTTNLGNFRKI